MPLLKLWNSLLGRSNKQPSADPQPASVPLATSQAKGTQRGAFNLFGGGPHAGLCKLLKSAHVSSVLEISVEDGSRAIAVLETLAKNQPAVRYLAIDQFEMAGGPVTLKQFHQTLRAKGIRPQLFPETMERGLIRVAHTVGAVDLVLIAAPLQSWKNPAVLNLLSRVSRTQTAIYYLDGESWKQLELVSTVRQRAA